MAVVVKLGIKAGHNLETLTSAIASTGFGSNNPEIVIPWGAALNLSLKPRLLLTGAASEEYRGSKRFKAYVLRHCFAWVVMEVGLVDVTLAVVRGERGILLSDDALNLILLSQVGSGIHRQPTGKLGGALNASIRA